MPNKHHNNFWTPLLTPLMDHRGNSTDANNIVTDYTYDAGNRIANWNRAGAPVNNGQSWNYDDNGNWISTTKDGVTEARNHDNTDQLTQIAGKASTNDAKGNLTAYEQNGKEYEIDYDLDNRIIKVDIDNNDVEKYRRLVGILDLESETNVARRVSSREADANQYRYDALGRRVIRQEGTTKTALIWWGNSEKHRRLVGVLDRMSGASEARRVKAREASLNQCAEHKHQAGQTVIQNDIMAHPSRLNSVIARAVDGSKFKLEWYHKNYLDHVYAVSKDNGDILEHYRYTAFGEVQIYNASGNQVATTQIDNHILWNTRRRDELTGYYMYKYRHYSAELGRWPSRDPIEERGGVNLYGFVGNSPTVKWDRLGLEAIDDPAYDYPSGECCLLDVLEEVMEGEYIIGPDSIHEFTEFGADMADLASIAVMGEIDNVEFCGSICRLVHDPYSDSGYDVLFATSPNKGEYINGISKCDAKPCPKCTRKVGVYHAHTYRSGYGPSSPEDQQYALANETWVFTGRGFGHVELISTSRTINTIRLGTVDTWLAGTVDTVQ